MRWKEFCRSQEGASLVFVAVTLPALVGFGLLAVDASRVYNLHYDLQKGADAFALAAAAELDRSGDACDRADRAIDNLLANQHSLSDLGIHTLVPGDITANYLTELPADDDTPIDYGNDEIANCPTATPDEQRQARFVEVVINPTQITSIFPATFLGAASNSLQPSASAVAGFGQNVCKFTPFYICNPWEGTGISLEEAANDLTERRRLIELRPSGGTGEFPGSFGYLEAHGGPGAAELRDSIARVNPGACFAQDDGVEIETGAVIGPVRQAINTRFDIYEGSFNSNKNDPNYRPALNVRKGLGTLGSDCNPDWDPGAGFMGLPRDDCFSDPATCGREADPPTLLGDGDWDLTTYWDTNHPGTPFPAGSGWADTEASRPTRYEVYRAEAFDSSLNEEDSLGGEDGVPICYSGGTPPSNDPDRRIVYAAVLNCQEIEDDELEEPYPVETFASFFLIEPLPTTGGASDPNLYIELVGINNEGGGEALTNVARDDVQLYR